MSRKRSFAQVKVEAPAVEDLSSDSSSSDDSSPSAAAARDEVRSMYIDYNRGLYRELPTPSLLALVAGFCARSSAAFNALSYNNARTGRSAAVDAKRVLRAALFHLTDTVLELTALERCLQAQYNALIVPEEHAQALRRSTRRRS